MCAEHQMLKHRVLKQRVLKHCVLNHHVPKQLVFKHWVLRQQMLKHGMLMCRALASKIGPEPSFSTRQIKRVVEQQKYLDKILFSCL